MQSSSAFIRISGPIPKVKTALINDYKNIVAYSEQSEQSEVQVNSCGLFLIYLRGSEGWCHPKKTWLFLLSFKLGNNITSTQTETKLLYKYKHILESW